MRLRFAGHWLCVILLLSGFTSAIVQPPRIGISAAFDRELAYLLERTDRDKRYNLDGVMFTTGTLAGRDVVLFLTDVSMVNAAMNTQRAFDHFNITQLMVTGIAGGLAPDARLGDVVIPARWAQYQEAVYARPTSATAFAPPPWLQPLVANFGMLFPKAVSVQGEAHAWFEADPLLLAAAEAIAPTVTLSVCLAEGDCLAAVPQVMGGGVGVSGQAFVDNAEFAAYLHSAFGAQVVDTESAAVAQVAYANNVPLLIVRGISDLPGVTDPAEIDSMYPLAADNAARMILALLEGEL